MPSVFVSHSSQDRDLVRALIVECLEQHGLTVWYSPHAIQASQEWEARIRHGLESSEWFIVALSPNSLKSEWVRAEVGWAIEHRRGKVVPVLIGDCQPHDCHLLLRQIQYIDLRGDNAAGKTALLNVWGLTPKDPGTSPQLKPAPKPTKRTWILALAGAFLLTGIALGSWAIFGQPGPPNIDNGDKSEKPDKPHLVAPLVAKAPPVLLEVSLAAGELKPSSDDLQVTFEQQRKPDGLHVGYRIPYVERQRKGDSVPGVRVDRAVFIWEAPVLSVKVLNNSDRSIMLTECIAEVAASQPNVEPVLIVCDKTVNALLIINEGWGNVIDPVLTFKILPVANSKVKDAEPAERRVLELKTFDKDVLVRLDKYVPKALDDESAVTVAGELEYGPAGKRTKMPFVTSMIFQIYHGTPIPPMFLYDLGLTAGKTETIRVPVSHNVKPGEADQFLLRIASDKSARYEIGLVVRTIDGSELPRQNVVLDLFVPRTMAKKAEKAPSLGVASAPK